MAEAPDKKKESEALSVQDRADAMTAIGGGRTMGGVRVSALLEITIFFAIIFAIDFGLMGGGRFADVSPHPYWFIIIVISIQYGTTEGLLAALAATIALRSWNIPEPSFNQEVFDYVLLLMRQPMMWLMAAVLMGELRVRQKRFQQEMRDALMETREREERITEAYNRVNRTKEMLETRAAGQMRTVVGSIQAAKAVEQQEPALVMNGAADIIQQVLNPKKFSLFGLDDGALKMRISRGWDGDESYKTSLPESGAIYQRVVGQHQFLSVVKPDERDALDGEGMLVGPLLSKETGNVSGLMKLEELGFMDLNVSTVENFKALCEWIGTSLDNANRYQDAKSDSVLNHEHQLFSFGFFPKQVQLFTSLAQRLKFEVCLIIIRLENADNLNLEERRKIPPVLSEALRTVMRTTDMAFDYERPGYDFALLLPATPVKNLHFVLTKLDEAIETMIKPEAPRAKFSIQTQILHQVDEEKPKETPPKPESLLDGTPPPPAAQNEGGESAQPVTAKALS
ncbi:GAF domain-containing protein [Magnetococcus sp. PR-3]|uniref:GAF domain-containing protein n=1 Tax=Magnetococcus sp. PR-3 TaxID=3120355 RepID=UPI002FCE6299